MNKPPDLTKWTDAQLQQTPAHIFGKHLPAVDAEIARRKAAGITDGSIERVARIIKENTPAASRRNNRKR